MTKLPARIALGIALALLAAMYFIPVMKLGYHRIAYMRDHIVLIAGVALPMIGILINLSAGKGKSLTFRRKIGTVTNILIFLLMGLLLFMYFDEADHRSVTLMPAYFLPAFALLLNGMAIARWQKDEAEPDN